MPPDSLSRLDPSGLTVVFDRPTQPGNLGTLARSADAFGANGLVVTGHAADSAESNNASFWGEDCTKIDAVNDNLGESAPLGPVRR